MIKKTEIKGVCSYLNDEGHGVIKQGETFYNVEFLLPEEIATISVGSRGNYLYGKINKIEKTSKYRIKSICNHFEECGGCNFLHYQYEEELRFKKNIIVKLFNRNYIENIQVNNIIKMDNPLYYRNKVQMSFRLSKTKKNVIGFFQENSNRIVPIESCYIQNNEANKIVNSIKEITNELKIYALDFKEEGFLRHVLIKKGFKTNEIMVVIITKSENFPARNEFVKKLRIKHPEITTIIQNVNGRDTSIVLGEKERILYGKGFILDELCGLSFKISAKSFYQVNPIQTEILYKKAIELAKITKEDIVFDAYSGIGTIGLIASKEAKEVISVESNGDAVKDAIYNAKINNIRNIYFYKEDATKFALELAKDQVNVDVVFMDPPRNGSTKEFLQAIHKLKAKKIIYISCNPYTLVDDLKILTELGYAIKEVQPVDLFPRTIHVETVVCLSLK